MDKDKIQRMTTNKGIKWKFNPPGGSHFGGVHEIMFEAAKKAIYAVLRSSDITDEELTTPTNFLYGQMGGQFAPESVGTMRFNPRKRW